MATGVFKQEPWKNRCFSLNLPSVTGEPFTQTVILVPKTEDSTMAETLDKTDIQILRVLQENARITVKDLALKVHLSPTPVFERLHRLENEGYIRKYTTVLDAAKLGRGFLVFCSVRLRRMGKDIANDFVNRVKDIPEVAECYNISGDFDYLLKIYAPDMQYYNNFLINTLGTIDSLGSVQSSFVMSEIKNNLGLPL